LKGQPPTTREGMAYSPARMFDEDQYMIAYGGCNIKKGKCYNDYYLIRLSSNKDIPLFFKGNHTNMGT